MIDRPLVPAFLARGSHGAVVAPHHLATSAGLAILRAGGSAVDAAITTNAVLTVVDNEACGIGGDAFWLIWDAPSRRQLGLNGSGRSARTASAANLRARGVRSMAHRGGLSITVPGATRSWGDAHDRFGRLGRKDLLAPAIEMAEDGFPADDAFRHSVEASAPVFERELGRDAAGWLETYRPAGRPWRLGERVRLPALAGTLERIAADGWAAMYEGELADRQAIALAAAGSEIRAADLRDHRSTWTEPISTDYRGVRVTGHPPNSSGFVALELLNILEQFEPPGTSLAEQIRWAHLGIEASKLAMADRDVHLADPEHYQAPLERLLDRDYARALAGRIDLARAASPTPSRLPGGGGTIWLGVVDAEGNAVSLIQSNYAGFGSGIVDPVTGIAYQNRGSYFSLDEDHPNVLGPARRTLHTLMPGMLFRAGRPWIVTGSMGGDAQPQVHAQVVSALVDGGADVAAAVARPRWFVEPAEHYAPPDIVRIEPRFEPGLLEGLTGKGHRLAPTEPYDGALGHCHAIEIIEGGLAGGGLAGTGSLAAATDPRSQGLPATW